MEQTNSIVKGVARKRHSLLFKRCLILFFTIIACVSALSFQIVASDTDIPVSVSIGETQYAVTSTDITGYDLGGDTGIVEIPIYKVAIPKDSENVVFSTTSQATHLVNLDYEGVIALSNGRGNVSYGALTKTYKQTVVPTGGDSNLGIVFVMGGNSKIEDALNLSNDIAYIEFTNAPSDYSGLFGLVIELQPEDSVNRTDLKERLDAVPKDGYYTQNDRFNGNGISKKGFWADMQAIVSAARRVYEDETASQAMVDAAAATLDSNDETSALSKAIANLIPADRLNTTPLYEALQEVNSLGYNDLSLKAYTETSAAKFKAGRDDAQKYLDSLFTGEEGNRKPSDKNKNTDENQTALNAAVATAKNLPTLLVHQSLVSYSEQNTKTIQALAARYGAGENPGYTEESWSALQSARTDALAYIKAHPVTDRLTKDENRGLREKANTLWNAICALKSTKEQISVTLTYTDDYHLRLPSSKLADKSGLMPGSASYKLTNSSTLRDLFTTAGFTSPNGGSASDKYPGLDSDADALRRYGWSIRVNGVQQTTGLIGD